MAKDKNHVSLWFWLFAFFIAAIPCIGQVMIVVWAFSGENQSRKNYFRAVIVMVLFWTALWMALMSLGFWPEVYAFIQKQVQHIQYWRHWPK